MLLALALAEVVAAEAAPPRPRIRDWGVRIGILKNNFGATPEDEEAGAIVRTAIDAMQTQGAETIDELEGKVLDAGLIAAAQKVEHYEIAAYGSVCAYAKLLDRSDDLNLLKETLEEEKRADEKLTELSENVNQEAAELQEENAPAAKTANREHLRARKTKSAA